jgi:hypothetical protein
VKMVALEWGVGDATAFGVKYPFQISGPWYLVKDPDKVRKRVEIINTKPVMLMVLAKRLSRVEIFGKTPQQSDYASLWRKGTAPGREENAVTLWLRKTFSETFCREVLPRMAFFLNPLRFRGFRKRHSFSNSRFFELANCKQWKADFRPDGETVSDPAMHSSDKAR